MQPVPITWARMANARSGGGHGGDRQHDRKPRR
jgi:hypothetical protein